MKKNVLIIFSLFLFSCDKEKPEEYYYPIISNINVTPTQLYQFTDSLVITFNYTDNDGNLGFEDPNLYALRIKDSRLENPDWFHVQPLAPPNEKIPISGTLNVSINSVFLLSSANQEIFTYTISIMDREGNWSNELISMPITIMR